MNRKAFQQVNNMNNIQKAYQYFQLADHRYNCYIDAGNKAAGYNLFEFRHGYSNSEHNNIGDMSEINNKDYIEKQLIFYNKLAESYKDIFISAMLKFVACINLDKVTDNELRELLDAYPDDFYVLAKFFKTLNIYNIRELVDERS